MEPIKKKVEESYETKNENIKNGFNNYSTATIDSFIVNTQKVEKENINSEANNKIVAYLDTLFYSQIINVSERESSYVIDGLMHNDVAKSDIFFTDIIGFSEIIFGLTHIFGMSFAPRIKNFKKLFSLEIIRNLNFQQSKNKIFSIIQSDLFKMQSSHGTTCMSLKKSKILKLKSKKMKFWVKTLKNSSIVHWSHVNFYGEYDFTWSFKKTHTLIG